jgi:hypothetical protein
MSDRIKVVGYAQKVSYTDGIEYRNFTPDLVGLQLASNGGTPLLTMGNFAITTNFDPKLNKTYNTSKFSEFLTLDDLKVSLEETKTLLADNAGVFLNLNKSNLNYYALFGSLSEYMRIALENIIINWPASLYLKPLAISNSGFNITGYTAENYVYDKINEIANFKINTTFINNTFQIIYTSNGSIANTFNATNDLRNFTVNYKSYVVLINGIEYPILNYTASTYETNDYAYFSVKGDPFSGVSDSFNYYHIKPSKLNSDKFFNTLPDLEAFLLNRNVFPIYTAVFKYPIKTEQGVILYTSKTLTWPVSDGYNIDFNTTDYNTYASSLFELSSSNDLVSSNLMNRFLVSESITQFDTTPVYVSSSDEDTTGQKMNKTLQLYGVEFDEINKFISGIQFANTVSYDKEDNTPDVYLKDLARVLGWDLVSSVLENDLLANYVTTRPSTYSGQSVGLTAVEADIELWRRIILNSPWLWKSKGARKSIEFLLRFIGAPKGLVNFNEYVYKAEGPINVDLFREVLRLNGLNDDISFYPIDSEGYPRPLADTVNMYFQNDGLWYRETGGSNSTIDILTGNNPHVGPYDGGYKYFNQFKSLIPNFLPVTVSSIETTVNTQNLYTNYDSGSFNNGVSTETTVDTVSILSENGININDCIVFTPSIELDPNPTPVLNDCGCETPTSDNILSLCIDKSPKSIQPNPCGDSLATIPIDDTTIGLYVFNYYQYKTDGTVYSNQSGPIYNTSYYTPKECCTLNGGIPFLYDETTDGVVTNTGYACCDKTGKCGCTIACKWMMDTISISLPPLTSTYTGPQNTYLQFIKPDGTMAVVSPDGCNCNASYTTRVPNVVDPYNGQIGYGCQLTTAGLSDLALGTSGDMYTFYQNRVTGKTSCFNPPKSSKPPVPPVPPTKIGN